MLLQFVGRLIRPPSPSCRNRGGGIGPTGLFAGPVEPVGRRVGLARRMERPEPQALRTGLSEDFAPQQPVLVILHQSGFYLGPYLHRFLPIFPPCRRMSAGNASKLAIRHGQGRTFAGPEVVREPHHDPVGRARQRHHHGVIDKGLNGDGVHPAPRPLPCQFTYCHAPHPTRKRPTPEAHPYNP